MSRGSGPTGEGTRISVVIPAHDVEPYVGEAVRSALVQTHANVEVVVVDDGSTDGTASAVERFRDDRLRLVRKPNGGCASSRNAGLAVARGEFVAFLDGDDFWHPRKLERELSVLEADPSADLVFSLSEVVDESGRNLGLMKSGSRRSFDFEDLLVENPVGNGSAVLIRRDALDRAGPFDESLPASSDCDMWLRLARLRARNFVCLPEVFTYYRRRDGQTTGHWRRMQDAHERVLAKARAADPSAVARLEHLSRCHRNRYLSFIAYESGDVDEARRLLRESTRCAPSTSLRRSQSWLLAGAILSKQHATERLHGALERAFLEGRRRFYQRRIG